MLTGTEEEDFDITAMDPIDGYVHLSDYSDLIYGVRVVSAKKGAGADRITADSDEAHTAIHPEGTCLRSVSPLPAGYTREAAPEGSFQQYSEKVSPESG